MGDYNIIMAIGCIMLIVYVLYLIYVCIYFTSAIISHRLKMYKERKKAKEHEENEKVKKN